jgi:hypothetical protein
VFAARDASAYCVSNPAYFVLCSQPDARLRIVFALVAFCVLASVFYNILSSSLSVFCVLSMVIIYGSVFFVHPFLRSVFSFLYSMFIIVPLLC